ncbi:MAG: hypothetical protein HQL97_02725 [Magnetococcales bacterium]|nr:hypothetical protein [Magnetococcales bacterium]
MEKKNMKKSILLGAAALAAIALAAPQAADAGEVKLGGYYMFRMVSTDNTTTDTSGDENKNFWAQRLQLNVDMKASEKSHAHMVTRVWDGNIVNGSDVNMNTGDWHVRQLWLETEAWGVGVKVGNMPIALNDGLLVDNDVTSFGSILLAKNFGGVTLVAADVKVAEGVTNAGGNANATTLNENDKDADLFVLSALGKIDAVDYQLTGAYLTTQPNSGATFNGIAIKDMTDGWIALTLAGKVQSVDLTGTIIYETGADLAGGPNTTQAEKSGVFLGGRAKGPTGFGGWNGYAFWGSKDFTSPLLANNEAKWSPAWDSSGPGSQDLMQRALTLGTSNTGKTGGGNDVGAASTGDFGNETNMYGLGAGLTINASAWTIKPSLDYAHVTEDVDTARGINANYVSAWGGTLGFSTKIQEATSLDLSGTWVKPKLASAPTAGLTADAMHYVQASVRMDF